jgi:hypothetical protein
MQLIFIASLAIGQTAVERRADLVMQAAVEDSVQRHLDATPSAGRGHPPEPWRSMISHLGANCYGCRERASKRLAAAVDYNGQRATDNGRRWLFWGRHHPDPEIRLRCNNILRNLTRCRDCDGTGLCVIYRPDPLVDPNGPCTVCKRWPWGHPESPGPCLSCGGKGFAWTKGAFE